MKHTLESYLLDIMEEALAEVCNNSVLSTDQDEIIE